MERQYVTVLALNKYIKAKMNQDVSLQNVYIQGEISNYRPHPSGHLYFTLKDENSRINAVMFASQAKQIHFQINNGMKVFIKANVSVYEVTGQYQLYVQSMKQDGIGELYLRYESLKKKLQDEGLFLDIHKKRIPLYPRNIAVLSAKQGAAVQDVVRTIHLRFPVTKVIVFPVPVQGKEAYLSIMQVLMQVDQLGFDTIILARGGGSIEDLWNFNEEALARCIFDCQTPIITGIGHETDFTICDFVSDYRGATPTAAAVKATPDIHEMTIFQNQLKSQLFYKMKQHIHFKKQSLERLQKSYYLSNPEHLITNQMMRLTHLQDQLQYQFKMFDLRMIQQMTKYQEKLKQTFAQRLYLEEYHLQKIMLSLDNLSPLKVMQRGYTLIKKEEQVIKSANDLNSDDLISIQFYDGIKDAQIK